MRHPRCCHLFIVSLFGITSLILLNGCHSTGPAMESTTGHTVHPDTVSEQDSGMLGEISKLAGNWEMADENGKTHPATTFAITSGGSAVREIMWAGQQYEMTNLYHMDGGVLVCTHYCAAGNQPRMVAARAEKTSDGMVFRFDIDSVSNLRESHDHYMGNMTLTILDDGGLRQDWRSYDREGNLTEPAVFLLSRSQN